MVAGSAGAGHDATDRLRLCRGGPAFPWLPMPRDFLPGFPPPNDIVHSFRAPSTQLILDYFDAAHERTTSYLATLGPDDLDRELDAPQHDPLPTVSVRLVSVSMALAQSSGPIRYRLWLAGKGR